MTTVCGVGELWLHQYSMRRRLLLPTVQRQVAPPVRSSTKDDGTRCITVCNPATTCCCSSDTMILVLLTKTECVAPSPAPATPHVFTAWRRVVTMNSSIPLGGISESLSMMCVRRVQHPSSSLSLHATSGKMAR